jgi:hypothetical protein
MIYDNSIQGALRDLAKFDVWDLVDNKAPVDGVAGTGKGLAGKGSRFTDISTGTNYVNMGTKASPLWKAVTTAA